MKIEFNRHKISGGDYLNGFIDNELQFKLRSSGWFIWNNTQLVFDNKDNLLFKAKRRWILPKYRILNSEKEIGVFKPENIWKLHYILNVENESYEIIGHKGHKVSIFKDGSQIAWFHKISISWFNGINYTLTCNSDSNKKALALIVLCWNDFNEGNDSEDTTVTFDLGNIGPEAKKFDTKWKEK